MATCKPRENYRPWTRAEYDLVEKAIMRDNRQYASIAAELGRSVKSVRGAAQRIGVSSCRRHWRSPDWSKLDRKIVDMLECELMTPRQIAEKLTALGNPVHKDTIYRRIAAMPHNIRERARRNGTRIRVATGERVQRRRKLAA
ncbi:hypothetical protein F0A16_02910 [Salinicola corii]|uniref:Myb-like domain-containing protein n=1 Tax=Salinicola corii TaxID=2606937 RepID=A0A640WJK4_9GAMM|nr:hypothetical protein [Salinicola corii]KAA0020755.1 hypothetical protein F0A16_02910 [Salinicola corii]